MEPTFNGKPGDLIEIFRGLYQHWAVYIGQNEVVHLVPEGGGSSDLLSSIGKVKREKLTDVVGHHHFKVNNLLDEEYKAHEPYVIVKEALAMVGRVLQYNVVSYNCQHFAIEMRYGKAESRQVQTAAVITAVAFAALGAALFSSLLGKEEEEKEEEEEDYRKKTRRHHQHWH